MTPHIEARKEEIAKTVIMPGDPLRAKFIAETYLTDYKLINNIRGMLGYTGYYKGKQVTVMASGMGIPSIGIYSYELYNFYDVEKIIRVGSAGSYKENIKLYDIVLVTESYSLSSYAAELFDYNERTIESTRSLTNHFANIMDKMNVSYHHGKVNCAENFYSLANHKISEDVIAVEMETFALFANAKALNKEAACLLTISDNLVTKEETTPEERQTSFTKMMEIALESLI